MAYCPAGHTSTAADYCDQCGLPIESGGGAPPARVVAEAPAGAVCAGVASDGMPVGLQIVAPACREDLVARIGAAYERTRPPGYNVRAF